MSEGTGIGMVTGGTDVTGTKMTEGTGDTGKNKIEGTDVIAQETTVSGAGKKGRLYMIGLGLGDERDISVRGLDALRACGRVFLDTYTSVLTGRSAAELAAAYGCAAIEPADRYAVESGPDAMLAPCLRGVDVAFLVVGDPFGATTHADLYVRAASPPYSLDVVVVHNASIINAAAACGLQLYLFGATASVPFFTERWRPYSVLDRFRANWAAGLHTLFLLDIRTHERSDAALAAREDVYEPPRFMTVRTALEQLLEASSHRPDDGSSDSETDNEGGEDKATRTPVPGVTRDSIAVALVRIGCADQRIVAGTVGELLAVPPADDVAVFGPPLHALAVPGPVVHDVEWAVLRLRALPSSCIRGCATHRAFVASRSA